MSTNDNIPIDTNNIGSKKLWVSCVIIYENIVSVPVTFNVKANRSFCLWLFEIILKKADVM
jgi:hypothetical protein